MSSLYEADVTFRDSDQLITQLNGELSLSPDARHKIQEKAFHWVQRLREKTFPSLLESFLVQYGLSSDEGVALMELAEALLRTSDYSTARLLVQDKVCPHDWEKLEGESNAWRVNLATSALRLTTDLLSARANASLVSLAGRFGEPFIIQTVRQAMKAMGGQFVLGESIETAIRSSKENTKQGVTYSYDMLGEAALTTKDAKCYTERYKHAIKVAGKATRNTDITENPSISIKLSALHPRYEVMQRKRVLAELVPTVVELCRLAKQANLALSIDAEEQDRLALSFDVAEKVLADPSLSNWNGFGMVIQAYGKRAHLAIDRLYQLARKFEQRVNVRLAKGAYWDTEIKHAQVEGLPDYPVYTRKPATDVAYICLARQLFDRSDWLVPQFATHNAHTMAAVEHLAGTKPFEFQRLHGMGEGLHRLVKSDTPSNCRFRIYAPVGEHKDLLAYLVRRLLENGANSSFVNKVMDLNVPVEKLVQDPFDLYAEVVGNKDLRNPSQLFAPQRRNSKGFDLSNPDTLSWCSRTDYSTLATRSRHPLVDGIEVTNPSTGESIAYIPKQTPKDLATMIDGLTPWNASAAERFKVLNKAADLFEAHCEELFNLLGIEAGKTAVDRVGELREAVDFLRFYAAEANAIEGAPLGTVAAISPWNFPLAIFTGQIAGALAVGNAVIAKPAIQTPLIALKAVELLHKADVPQSALQLIVGRGSEIGNAITSNPHVNGILFTGSTSTAKQIVQRAARFLEPGTPVVAETGGINAMIVDSTALPEQAVQDVIASAFQSAGQRCSALRCLYVQEEIADDFIDMLKGAMDQLNVGPADQPDTDVGPVIETSAQIRINAYLIANRDKIIHQVECPESGSFVRPTLLLIDSIKALNEEIFGPVLHVTTFKASDFDDVIRDINSVGYGLTFGLHSRIKTRAEYVKTNVKAGNIYINRNQIGAVVGSQPFGGEGLSGTGPKAGSSAYLQRLVKSSHGPNFSANSQLLPGPSGEENELTLYPRAPVLCLGPGEEKQQLQAEYVRKLGGMSLSVMSAPSEALSSLEDDFSAVLWWGDKDIAQQLAVKLSEHDGPIVPLICDYPDQAQVKHQRHFCTNTAASGGDTKLLNAN